VPFPHSEKTRPRQRRRGPQSARRVSICDGRDLVGVIDQIDDAYIAVDVTGEMIGKFASLRAAARALPGGGER
jgi:hypothetical protein